MLSGSITIRRRCGKIFSNPGLFLIFSSFSHHNSNLNWKSADVVLGNRTQGRKLIVEDGSTELKRPPMKEVWVATKDQLKIWFVQAAATNTQSETKRIIPNVFFLFLWQDIFDNKLAVPCNEKNSQNVNVYLAAGQRSVWPNFRNFRNILQVFGKISKVYFLFGKILNLLCHICFITGLIFIVTNGQILKHN